MNAKHFSTLFFMLFVAISPIWGQNATISGFVIDKVNNEPMFDATIKLVGTEFGTLTNLDGRYTVSVPAGTYTVEASYITYVTQTQQITVAAGESYTADFSLSGDEQVLEAVVVQATVEKQSVTGLLNLTQRSPTIMTGVSQDDIRRTPDRTTSDVLRRVSGTSIQDNRFVVVRGLSERYVASLINGMALPSTEPDKRAFAFDIFPSTLLDNLLVFKTANPDLPGDFAGGVVQINTKEIPEKSFFAISLGAGYNSQSTFQEWQHYDGGGTDWLASDDGTRALPAGTPIVDTMRARLLDFNTRIPQSRTFANTWAYSLRNSMPLIYNMQLSGGLRFKAGEEGDFGMIAALTYNNSHRMTEVTRNDYNFNDTSRLYTYYDRQYANNVSIGGLLNLSYAVNSRHRLTLNNVYSRVADDVFVTRDGSNYAEQRFERANSMQYTETAFWSTQFQGEHRLETGGKFTWGLNIARVNRDVPDFRRMFYSRNFPIDSTETTVFQAFVPFGQASPSYAGRFYSTQQERVFGLNAEIELPYGKAQKSRFRGGFNLQTKRRNFDARVLGYVVSNFVNFDPALLLLPQEQIFDTSNITQDRFRMSEITNPSDSYDASSFLFAPYAMIDQYIGEKLRITGGLRFEVYRQKLTSTNFGGTPIRVDSLFADLLPSVNFSYSLTEKSKLRLSASRTVNRPNFREIAPFAFYDFNLSAGIVGNDTVTPARIWNFDLRYEIFPGANQMFAVTAFYKQFVNAIEQFTDAGTGGTSRQFTFGNVRSAYDFGLELEARIRYPLTDNDALNFTGNAAWIQSRVDVSNIPNTASTERPLQGQSPYVLNFGIGYTQQKLGFGVNLLYNQIGRRIWQVGYAGYNDVWESSRPVFDIQLSQRFAKNGEVKINVSDIFNQRLNFYQDENDNNKFDEGTDNVIQSMIFGRNVSLSIAYKFQ